MINDGDGCSHWFDGDWRHCCDLHDAAYLDGAVSLETHVELGICVAQTSGGILMGAVMAAATLIWWLVRRSLRRSSSMNP